MPSSKQSLRVVTYRPDPNCPRNVFERLLFDREYLAKYVTSVFDIGDDILELLSSEWYDLRGEFVYENCAVMTVRRNVNGSIRSVMVRFTSAKIAEKLLGNHPKGDASPSGRKRVIFRRRRVGPESK
jgi:hypothetical protein